VVVEGAVGEAVGLRSWPCPDGVHAVLAASIERAESVAFVEGYEQGRPCVLERVTVQNVRDQTTEIIVSRLLARARIARDAPVRATASTMRIVAIVRCDPHEIRRGARVKILGQRTVSSGARGIVRRVR